MDARAVIALRIILSDDLPVSGDVVLDAACATQVGQREPFDVLPQVRHRCRQVRCVRIERHEHESLPRRRLRRDQPVVGGVEVDERLRVASPPQAAIEVIGPSMIWTLEPDEPTCRIGADLRSPVAAYVMERADHVILAPDDDEALPRDLRDEEAARPVDVLLPGNTHPRAPEPGCLLEGQHVRVMEHAWWQEARLVHRPTCRGHLRRRDRRRASGAWAGRGD